MLAWKICQGCDVQCPPYKLAVKGTIFLWEPLFSSLSLANCVFPVLIAPIRLTPSNFSIISSFTLCVREQGFLRSQGWGICLEGDSPSGHQDEGFCWEKQVWTEGMMEALDQEVWRGSEEATLHSRRSWLERVETRITLPAEFQVTF